MRGKTAVADASAPVKLVQRAKVVAQAASRKLCMLCGFADNEQKAFTANFSACC